MSQLAQFRLRLRALRRRRQAYRSVAGGGGMLAAVLGFLAVTFLLDVVFHLTVPQRMLVLAAGLGLSAWFVPRYIWPLVSTDESDVDLALLVEKTHHVRDDLVASLEFDQASSSGILGSAALREAVVQHACWLSNQLNVFAADQNVVPRPVWGIIGLAVLLAGSTLAVRPSYTRVFWNRLALGKQQYPTRTRLDALWVNGQRVALPEPEAVRVPTGSEVFFTAYVLGDVPEQGRVTLRGHGGTAQVDLAMQRTTPIARRGSPPEQADDRAGKAPENLHFGRFSVTLPRLREPVSFQLWIGDTYTEPADLIPLELPLLDLYVQVTEPTYAPRATQRVFAGWNPVLPYGATVDLIVRSSNKKLRSVDLVLSAADRTGRPPAGSDGAGDAADQPLKLSLHPQAATATSLVGGAGGETTGIEEGAEVWRLSEAAPQLSPITHDWRFEVRAVDVDGLIPAQEARGLLRLVPDAPPAITIETIHPLLLATATPRIGYSARDDFGLARLELLIRVNRRGVGETEPDRPAARHAATNADADADAEQTIVLAEQLGARPPALLQGEYRLSLTPFELAVGDEVVVTPRATDYRGELPSRSTTGTPVRWRITDQEGLLQSLLPIDERLERRLSDMIQQGFDTGNGSE